MASSNQNPNVKEIPSPSSICVKSPSIIRTASSLGRMIWLRKSAAVLRRHSRNSLTSTAPHLSDLTTERNTHVHCNRKPQQSSHRPVQPRCQNRRRDEVSGMDRESG